MPPGVRRHFHPGALKDPCDLGRVAPFSETIKLRFQEDQACTVLQGLRLRVPLESALLDQPGHALDCRRRYPVRREQVAYGLRLSPRRISSPPEVSLAARGEVLPGVSPPLEVLCADGYPEVFGRRLGEQA